MAVINRDLKVTSCYLSDLSSKLKEAFESQNNSEEIMNNAARILQQFGLKGVVKLIYEIINNSALLARIASASYLQVNGFYKISLLSNNTFTLRFHIWFPDNTSLENLHNHRWYLASTILNGSLHSEIWQDSALLESFNYDEYHYRKDKHDKHETVFIGKAKIELKRKQQHKAGDCYYLDPHTLHRIVHNKNELVATFMCHPLVSRQWSRIIVPHDRAPGIDPQYMTSNQLCNVFNKYLSFLE